MTVKQTQEGPGGSNARTGSPGFSGCLSGVKCERLNLSVFGPAWFVSPFEETNKGLLCEAAVRGMIAVWMTYCVGDSIFSARLVCAQL